MEDLIYILIGVIWIVFSIIKGTQKNAKKPAGTTQSKPSEKKSTLEEMLEEWLPPMPEPKYEAEEEIEYEGDYPAYSYEESPAYESSYDFHSDNYDEIEYETEIVSLEELDEIKPSLVAGNSNDADLAAIDHNHETFAEVETFNLRKAVIYNAILERPYV